MVSFLLNAEALTSLEDFYGDFGKRPPVYAPFTSPVYYSKIGFDMLNLVIEKVSNMTYADFVHKNIFQPVGMQHTSYTKPMALSVLSRLVTSRGMNHWVSRTRTTSFSLYFVHIK